MILNTFLGFSLPEQHYAPDADHHLATEVIIGGTLSAAAVRGRSTLLFPAEAFRAEQVYRRNMEGEWEKVAGDFEAFTFAFFTKSDREKRDVSYRWLASVLNLSEEEAGKLYPFLVLTKTEDETIVYHHLAAGKRGNLFSAYHWQPKGELDGPQTVEMRIREAYPDWAIARPNYNNNCWYTKWRRDVEIERKFTFKEPADNWILIRKLYRAVGEGGLPGFILEFNDEFQVWDFENYMFEILEPEEKVGYISFVPQSNGLMTVKQKTFKQDAEIRTETIKANIQLHPSDMRAYVQRIGTARELPHYRRKRFDINLESLETGNVYGIFMDLCRPLGDEKHALFQCEVEYIRSRVMAPIAGVMEDYETVCQFTKQFLLSEGVSFEEGYYSKLSYLRDYQRQLEPEGV